MGYMQISFVILGFLTLIWCVAGVYSIAVYLGNFIDDKQTKVDELVIFTFFGINPRRDVGVSDGEDLAGLFGILYVIIFFGSFGWIISVPLIVILGTIFYLRNIKRKQKEANKT